MAGNPRIAEPPSEIFKKVAFQRSPERQVIVPMNTYLLDHMESPESGGMFAWFVGCPFPAKGFPFPQAIYACNAAKRFFKQGIDVISSREMLLPAIGFLLSFKKISLLEKVLVAYTNSAKMLIEPYFLDPKRMCACALEIRIFLDSFLRGMGITLETSRDFAEVFSHLIQYDDAYRLRIEDLASMTSKESLVKNPAKEIKKLLLILGKREPADQNIAKFAKIGIIMRGLFLVPRIKKSFKRALNESKFENFQLDDADRYHLMLRVDYNAMGYTLKERTQFYLAWHSVFMPLPPRMSLKLQE